MKYVSNADCVLDSLIHFAFGGVQEVHQFPLSLFQHILSHLHCKTDKSTCLSIVCYVAFIAVTVWVMSYGQFIKPTP